RGGMVVGCEPSERRGPRTGGAFGRGRGATVARGVSAVPACGTTIGSHGRADGFLEPIVGNWLVQQYVRLIGHGLELKGNRRILRDRIACQVSSASDAQNVGNVGGQRSGCG